MELRHLDTLLTIAASIHLHRLQFSPLTSGVSHALSTIFSTASLT